MKLFGAPWCGPCGVTKAKIIELGFEFSTKDEPKEGPKVIEFINIDTNMEEAKANSVRGIPLLIDDQGGRFSGFEKIIEAVKSKA